MGRERVEFLISLIDCRALLQKFTPVTGDPGHPVFFLLREIVSSTATKLFAMFSRSEQSVAWFPVLLPKSWKIAVSLRAQAFPVNYNQIASIILNRSTGVVDFN